MIVSDISLFDELTCHICGLVSAVLSSITLYVRYTGYLTDHGEYQSGVESYSPRW